MSENAGSSSARHGARHAATGSGGARVPRRGGRSTGGTHFAGATTNHYQNYGVGHDYDSDGMAEQAAPRPVLDPAATGSFRRIDASMGAKVETRSNVETLSADSTTSWRRSGYGSERRLSDAYRPQTQRREPQTHANRKLIAGIAAAVVVVLALGGYLLGGILSGGTAKTTKTKQVEKTVVAADQSIRYRDATYSLRKQDDGTYAIVSAVAKGEGLQVMSTVPGTPASLVLYNGTIVVPENLDGNWDVYACTIGMGTPASPVVDSDGKAVGGSGTIKSVKLSQQGIAVTTDSGDTTSVTLSGSASAIGTKSDAKSDAKSDSKSGSDSDASSSAAGASDDGTTTTE